MNAEQQLAQARSQGHEVTLIISRLVTAADKLDETLARNTAKLK